MDIQVQTAVPGVKFESNTSFQKGSVPQNEETFGKFQRRPRKVKYENSRNKKEVLSTLLSSFGESIEDYSDNFLKEGVNFRDLSSLQDEDLMLMGFKNKEQRQSLIELFQQLPRQDPSYEKILNSAEAKTYNRAIMKSATSHMGTMKTALSAANYKLQIIPSEDVIVGDKSFASRFVLEAVEELKRATDEIENQLSDLEKAVQNKHKSKHSKKPAHTKRSEMRYWLMAGLSVCIVGAIWYTRITKTV